MGIEFVEVPPDTPNLPESGVTESIRPVSIDTPDTLWNFSTPSYGYSVGFKFAAAATRFDPKLPPLPTPKTVEQWRIGIVQNVMFERKIVEYEGMKKIETTIPSPLLDSIAAVSRPFAADPRKVPVTVDMFGTTLSLDEIFNPVRDLFYGPDGFGELLEPYADRWIPSLSKEPLVLSLADHPRSHLPTVFPNTRHELRRMARLLVFQFWIVAEPPKSEQHIVLAHSEKFTFVIWAIMPKRTMKVMPPLFVDKRDYVCAHYSGDFSKLDPYKAKYGHTKPIKITPGTGNSKGPVTKGETANEFGARQLVKVGLRSPPSSPAR